MRKLILTGLCSMLVLSTFILSSCEKEEEPTVYNSPTNPLSRAQVVVPAPAVLPPSAGTGNISASYDRGTRLLSYTITWSGLAANPIAIHIHGLAPAGHIALPTPLGPYTNGIIQSFTSGLPAATTGSFTGTLLIDNLVVREADLLAGQFYVDIHTNQAPFNNAGDIRGQITFP